MRQTHLPDEILVVDNCSIDGTQHMLSDSFPEVKVLSLSENSGGAGGFHEGVKWAYENGFTWIWLMDDDGLPVPDCLAALSKAARNAGLMAIAPLVIDRDNHNNLCFGLSLDKKYIITVDEARAYDYIMGHANLFNGLLLHRDVVAAIGFPMKELFIKGDEIDYYHRIMRAGFKIATFTNTEFYHPSGMTYRYPLLSNRFIAMYTGSRFKDYFLYRNMAYVNRKYVGVRGFLKDLFRYMLFFLVFRRFDVRGFSFWLRATVDGLSGNFQRGLQRYGPDK